MFVAILLPVAALVWALSRPAPEHAEPPTLDVQNHTEERPMTEAEFVRRWGRITGG